MSLNRLLEETSLADTPRRSAVYSSPVLTIAQSSVLQDIMSGLLSQSCRPYVMPMCAASFYSASSITCTLYAGGEGMATVFFRFVQHLVLLDVKSCQPIFYCAELAQAGRTLIGSLSLHQIVRVPNCTGVVFMPQALRSWTRSVLANVARLHAFRQQQLPVQITSFTE